MKKYRHLKSYNDACLGDSLGMLALGYSTTIPVTMDDMIRHGQAVRRGAPNTFLLACMPYQSSRTPEIAVNNSVRFMQEVGADAVDDKELEKFKR